MKQGNKKIAVVGIMSAMSAILMMLDFPIGLIPGFIKFDFSDLPALITSFYAGPLCGAVVVLLKNLVHLPLTNTMCVGEIGNFLSGCFFVVPAGLMYKFVSHTKKGALLGCIVGAASMSLLSIPLNYFITFPFYADFFGMGIEAVVGAFKALYPAVDSLFKAVVLVMVPFNFAKALVISLITMGIYKRISSFINRDRASHR